jgi:hypothetical protein
MDKKVNLKVNGQEIPLNPFVTTVVFNVVKGLVDSLDKIPDNPGTIELRIEAPGE